MATDRINPVNPKIQIQTGSSDVFGGIRVMLGTEQALLDICELIVDCEHKTAPIQETGYPSIRTPNIGRGRLILEGVNRVFRRNLSRMV